MSFFSEATRAEFEKNKCPGPAIKYVKKEVFPFLHTAQVTVPRNDNNNYDGVLNKCGEKDFKEAKTNAALGNFKDTLSDVRLLARESGRFFDPTGAWTDAMLNRGLLATLESTGEQIETSAVVFYGDDWAITISGSLYRLKNTSFIPAPVVPAYISHQVSIESNESV